MIWHSSRLEEIKNELGYDEKKGLSSSVIAGKLMQYGENSIRRESKKPFYLRLTKRFSDTMTVVLIIAAAIMLLLGLIVKSSMWYAPFLFLVVLAVNAVLTAGLELKTEKDLEQLQGAIKLSARVKRDGEILLVDTNTLVPGDIVVLETGDYIPADGRLLEAYSLVCDESAVTSNADPSEKRADATPEDICPLSERKNMVYFGCSVTFGHAVMVVTDTGLNTEFGRQTLLHEQTVGNQLTITKKLGELSRFANYIILSVAALVCIIGILSGDKTKSFSELVMGMITTAAALTVSTLPEALSGIAKFVYGIGIKRMSDKKVVVKMPEAVEKLGNVSVIISDKTGTLTKNKMKMSMLFDGVKLVDLETENPDENAITLIRTGALCCNGKVTLGANGKQKHYGDPTEVGIVGACLNYSGLTKDELENIYPRMDDVPFDSERKLMTTINMINNKPFAIVKGSPDILFECCTGGNIKGAAEAAEQMGKLGQRVIAVAIKPLDEVPSNPNPDNMECDLTLLGLFGMTDTITKETKDMIKLCQSGGISTVMLTGDHITTATAIAEKIGLLTGGKEVITGGELAKLSDDEFLARVRNIAVYSRITPQDKLRIVKAFQQLGETVAVTGDSVLDATVLKEADVGCAMGVTGTDIAKGSADIVLTEDSYISIGEAVKHSKGVYSNIKRVSAFLLSGNLSELIVLLFGFIIFGAPPVMALQLLTINLICNLFVSFALGEEDLANNEINPNVRKANLLSGSTGISVLLGGVAVGIITLVAYALGLGAGAVTASTMAFCVLCLSQALLAFNLRSEKSLFKIGFHTNLSLLIAFAIIIVLLIFVTATPISSLFAMSALKGVNVLAVSLLSFVPLVVFEGAKLSMQRYVK